MLTRVVLSAAATSAALLVASTNALDQTLYGLNYDLRQGPDWDPSKCKSASTITADLKVLSSITKNVRTYSLSDCDVAPVLTAAKSIGLTVWLGVWVSADSSVYDSEVAALKKLIQANLIDDNVVGFNVGSEAVYRKDITAEQSITYLKDFKSVLTKNKITTPVSITDIVDVLTAYPDMVAAGDVVTTNQFPFWEKMDASKAVAQFNKRIQPLLTLAGGKEVIISETGWPTAGTNANASAATPEGAGRYLNDFYLLAKEKGWKYYYFAGFDTPYKAEQAQEPETVEAYFGIFGTDGKMKSAYADLKVAKIESTESEASSTSGSSTGSSGTTSGTSGTDSTSSKASDSTSSKPTSSGTSTSSGTDSASPGSVHAGASSSTGTSGVSKNNSTNSNTNASNAASSQLATASLAACAAIVSAVIMSLHLLQEIPHTQTRKAAAATDMEDSNSGEIGTSLAARINSAVGPQQIDVVNEGLLVLVIDTNPLFWFADGQQHRDSSDSDFQQLIASTLVFVNSYLLLHRSNRIVIVAAHAGKAEMLYPDPNQQDTSGSAEQSAKVNANVMKKLQALSELPLDPAKPNATAIAASLSRSLCFINRAIREQSDLRPRILVIQKSPDVSQHYISIMNGIFSAQKKSVAVDACILASEHSSFMQQAAYLTGGIYYKPADHSGLLQYLLSIYLPDPSMRKLLKLPSQDSVDFRAMCFCHKEVISTAYVCPVCLSLFCEFQPICSTCGIRSRIQPAKKLQQQKKRLRST